MSVVVATAVAAVAAVAIAAVAAVLADGAASVGIGVLDVGS